MQFKFTIDSGLEVKLDKSLIMKQKASLNFNLKSLNVVQLFVPSF